MDTTIDGVAFTIDIQHKKKSLWYTATWECKLCGAKGDVSESQKQNTYAGASAAASGRARRHVEEKHKPNA
jgi:hypothetical protein